jgi:hypothetical protein
MAAVVSAASLSSAQATTWGHLRGPFSPEVQLRERLDYTAEERSEHSVRCMPTAAPRTSYFFDRARPATYRAWSQGARKI